MRYVGIFSVPRSGSSWIGELFNSSPDTRFAYQPMFAERFRDKIGVRSDSEHLKEFLDNIYYSGEDFLSQKDSMVKMERMEFPCKNHSPSCFVFKEVMFLSMIPVFLQRLQDIRIIFIIRNPMDVLTSWYNAPREFYPEWDIYLEWRFAQSKNNFLPERYYGYQKWEEATVLAYEMTKRYKDRFCVVCYEDIDKSPEQYTRQLFGFAGLEFTSQTQHFIRDSKTKTINGAYSVFRNDDTRNLLRRKQLPETIRNDISFRLSRLISELNWQLIERYRP